jgi:PKD repeat protein
MKSYQSLLVVTLFFGAAWISSSVATPTSFSTHEKISFPSDGMPVPDFTWTPEYPFIDELVTFDASGSYDADGYITDYAWDFDGDGLADKTGNIAKWSWDSEGSYSIHLSVCDNEIRCNGTIKTIRIVNETPVAIFEWYPEYPSVGTTVTLDASASFDPDDSIAWYAWDYDSDPYWDTVGGEEDKTVTYIWNAPGTYEVTLEVTDTEGHSDTLTRIIQVTLDHPPLTPNMPQGPSSGKVDVSYSYTAVTTDPDEDSLFYLFDWGDGTTSGWIGPISSGQTANADHTWNTTGTYDVKVKAKDIHDLPSDWSPAMTVSIMENRPPEKPSVPSGPPTGKIDVSYTYVTSASDPDGDHLYFLFDWGDGSTSGWLGPYISGQTVSATQIWETSGSFEIKSKAKDEQGDESPWSDPLTVTMPKGRNGLYLLKFLRYLGIKESLISFLISMMEPLC